MDYEKLIERLKHDYHGYSTVENNPEETFHDMVECLTALSTLQAENAKLRAELEQVKRALDEAREAICTHCMDFPCGEDSCYWWRGPEEV